MKTKRVHSVARVGLAVLAALVSPAILRAQVAAVAPTSPGATPEDVMAAASLAIPALKADASLASALVEQHEVAIRGFVEKIAAATARMRQLRAELDIQRAALAQMKEALASVETRMKELQSELDKLRAEATEKEALLATAERNRQRAKEATKDANSSLFLMRIIASDRAAASKLLDAMKQRNASSLGTLLDPGASPASIVSVDVLSPAAIKMIFKVGALTQCVATRPSCGTTAYAIMK